MSPRTPNTDDATPPLGTVLAGKYRLLREIGRGGIGVVFEAVNSWTERRVAVKVLRAKRPPDDVVERFLREARATSRVEHPNVVQVLDMGQDPELGTLFMVLEYLDGQNLRARLNEQPKLSAREACDVLVPIMLALERAHALQVVHRDVKPENILLAPDASGKQTPRLVDFGIARFLDPGELETLVTREGDVVGSVGYMSPEQAWAKKDIDGRADVWALGVVWFEALAGYHPFAGQSETQTLAHIATAALPSLARERPDLPPALCAAIEGALQRDRAARHASVTAFLAALRASGVLEPDEPPRHSAAPLPLPTPRNPARLLFALCAVVALTIALAQLLR